MAIGLIGKKIGMTRVFLKDGTAVPATIIEIRPNYVTAIKTQEKDGYTAIQVGAFEDKEKHLTKPQLGHLKKCGKILRRLKEFRVDSVEGFNTPLSTLPVTTVPRPDIVNTSSIGIRKGLSTSLCGVGIY